MVAVRPVLDVRLGDRVTLRKAHPCGGGTWDVVRLGADIGLVCTGCGRRVLLERAALERRLVEFVHRGPEVVVDGAGGRAEAAGGLDETAAAMDAPGGPDA